MIECLIYVLVAVLVAVLLVYVLEMAFGALGISVPPQVGVVIRLIAALFVLLYALRCFGFIGGGGIVLRP